jgi:hypothetical protein
VGAVVTDGQQVRWLAVTMSHMVADGWSNNLIRREIRRLVTGTGLTPPEDLVHPIDHKEYELSAQGRRANEAAQVYWLKTLRQFPSVYPGEGAQEREHPRYRNLFISSPDAVRGALAAAAKLQVSPGMVTIGAFAEVLGELTGLSRVPLLIRTANRARPNVLESVGHYAQQAPLLVDVPVTDSRRVVGPILNAERHGHFDPVELARRVEETWPDPADRPSLTMALNHIPTTGEGPGTEHDPVGGPEVQLGGGHDDEYVTVYCSVALGGSGLFALFVDTTFISVKEATVRLLDLRSRLIAWNR